MYRQFFNDIGNEINTSLERTKQLDQDEYSFELNRLALRVISLHKSAVSAENTMLNEMEASFNTGGTNDNESSICATGNSANKQRDCLQKHDRFLCLKKWLGVSRDPVCEGDGQS